MYSQEELQGLQAAMQALQQGHFIQAQALLQTLKTRFPANAEARHLLGMALFQLGHTERGIAELREALAIQPGAAHIHNNLANILMSLNQPEAALEHYAKAVEHNPNHAEAHHNLGNYFRSQGDFEAALKAYLEAARLLPDSQAVIQSLGDTYAALKQADAALTIYSRLSPHGPDGWKHFWHQGLMQQALGQVQAANQLYRQALRQKPAAAEIWFQLGELCLSQAQLQEAQTCHQQVLALQPAHAESHHSLGNVYFLQKQFAEAEVHYRQALLHRPELAEAANNLGLIRYECKDYDEAEAWVRKALAIKPDYAEAWINLASVHRRKQDVLAARLAYDQAIQLTQRPDLIVKRALMIPSLYDSVEEIQAIRQQYAQALDELLASDLRLRDPCAEVGEVPAHLHYQGPPWLDLAQKLAAFYRQACPALSREAPHCRMARRQPGDRLRIGIVASNFRNRHSIGKMFGELLPALDRQRFEVILYTFTDPAQMPDDEMASRLAASADAYVVLPESLFPAQNTLAEQACDILFYPEIGLDPINYFLPYARLAPLQLTAWFSSTGLDTVDLLATSPSIETDISRQYFCESLLETQALLPCFPQPLYQGQSLSREDFGMSSEGLLLGCLQSTFKLHPVMDATLAEILTALPDSRLVLIAALFAPMDQTLRRRLQRTLGSAYEQVIILPGQSESNFLQLAGCCDLLLDTWPVCGGNTSYDTL
ncbi:MAG: hypothetical protein CVV27_14970, partial [Candidatus Melainabacteria bacterium HGW-Melainabacteria-1]